MNPHIITGGPLDTVVNPHIITGGPLDTVVINV